MDDSKRKWTFSFEDDEQIRHDYPDNGKIFIGTDEEAIEEGKRLANGWEVKNNMWCFKIIRNSHGKIIPNYVAQIRRMMNEEKTHDTDK